MFSKPWCGGGYRRRGKGSGNTETQTGLQVRLTVLLLLFTIDSDRRNGRELCTEGCEHHSRNLDISISLPLPFLPHRVEHFNIQMVAGKFHKDEKEREKETKP